MVRKKYNKSYDELLTQAFLFHSELVRDLPLFSAFSPVFTLAYANNLKSMIDFVDILPQLQEYYNSQIIYSMKVSENMSVARAIYKRLLFNVSLAWADSEAILQNFGSNLYSNVGRSAPKMMTILQLAYQNASIPENKALLIAAGFLQADIDSINSIEIALRTAYNAQQDYIQQTFSRTEERILAFNALWDEMVLISGASKFIFNDSPTKKRFYLLYPSKLN
jgi:hypothetical protein